MKYEIEKLREEDNNAWDEFVESHENTSIFHTIAWKKILEKTYNYKSEYYVVKSADGKIVGVSPAFRVRSVWGKVIISQPFATYGGPCIEKDYENANIDILELYKNEVNNGSVKFVEIREVPNDKLIYFKSGFEGFEKAHIFHLVTQNKVYEKDIWHGIFNKRRRQEVKKALHNGLQIRSVVPTKDSIKEHYNLYLKIMVKLRSPPHSEKLFINIRDFLTDKLRLTQVLDDKKVVASGISFIFRDNINLWSMGRDSSYSKSNSDALLLCDSFKYATENRLNFVDLGSSEPNSSHAFYKLKWGAQSVPLVSYIYPSNYVGKSNTYERYHKTRLLRNAMRYIVTNKYIGPRVKKRIP